MTVRMSRRTFIQTTALAGGALVVGCRIEGGSSAGGEAIDADDAAFRPNAWVAIGREGQVVIVVDDMEMGQGVMTGLPMLVAEELAVDWETIRTEYGTADPSSWPRSIATGGSSSTRTSWDPLRRAGAAAREMLIAAAAAEWGVDAAACRAESGAVIHGPTGRRRTYAQLVEAAAELPVPEDPPLGDPSGYRIIGSRRKRLDAAAKVDGSHTYGIDVRVPDMRYAMVARSPVFGGTVRAFDDAAAREVPGVVDVVEISNGVAVIAEHTWAAKKGRDALEIEWDEGDNANLDDAGLWSTYAEMAERDGAIARDDGDARAAIGRAPASRRVEAEYRAPFLAHATMEPQNCTARVTPDGAEVWAPTQRLTAAQEIAAETAGLPVEAVVMHAVPPGGGFGRRLANDYVREAVEVAMPVDYPVKVVWTREDDTLHSMYRPAALHRVRAALDADGSPEAWDHRVVAPSVIEWQSPGAVTNGDGVDGDAVAGLDDLPYRIPNMRVDYVMAPPQVPLLWWRAVGFTHTVFAFESFIDELAHAGDDDPYEYRRRLLTDHPRWLGVLDAVAEAADWDGPVPDGRGRGIAVFHGFGSYVAQVAEASVDDDGGIRVHRFWCAVDCGRVVNPGLVEAQLQSGAAFGLTAALHGELTLRRGGFTQDNFDSYPILRMPEMPEVHPVLVESEEDPTGVGEPGVPAVAPAVANAVYAATGRRLRTLPLRMEEAEPVA